MGIDVVAKFKIFVTVAQHFIGISVVCMYTCV